MTRCAKQIALTLTAVVVTTTSAGVAGAKTDKSNIPQPAVLSKDSEQAGASNGSAGASPAATSAASKQSSSPALYWYDGQRKRMLSIDDTTLADFGSDPKKPAAQPKIIDQAGARSGKLQNSAGLSPMFRDPVSGQSTGALPGGVMVRTLRPLDRQSVDALARAFGTTVVRPIGSPNSATSEAYAFWLFEAPAGVPTLELANRMHESGQVSSASPNWWKPRQRK